MSWDKNALWSKSKIYFERATEVDRTDDVFGLWCSMGLELLSRSAIASINPCLLAEPDKDHKNLLSALGLSGNVAQRKSISTALVLRLCKDLIPKFTDTELTIASSLAGRRNEEVHSGTAAFLEYKTQQWIGGFYKCCQVLAEFQGESLESLFGDEEAKAANKFINELDEKVIQEVKSSISAHQRVFNAKDQDERDQLKSSAEKIGNELSMKFYHRVNCPSCECVATVHGEEYGKEHVEMKDDEIIVRRSVMPTKFSCPACELKLEGYSKLSAANIAEHYTNRTHFSPQEYFELIDPNDADAMSAYAEDQGYYHFSNE